MTRENSDRFWNSYMAGFGPQGRKAILLGRLEARKDLLPQAEDDKERDKHQLAIARLERKLRL